MIKCQDIRYSKGRNELLKGINWSFDKGLITSVIGPNGAGKSTLLKLLLGLEQPDSGQISLHHKPLNKWNIKKLANMRAYMAQGSSAKLGLPVFEYLALARIHKTESQHKSDAFVNQILSKLELGHLATRAIDRLSGGEFQRVELARAWCQLLGDNDVKDTLLILDEPSSALDIRQTQRLYSYLKQFVASGGSVIVVEHEINMAARFSDKILMLRKGRQVAAGDMQHTFTAENINRCFDVNGRTFKDPATQAIAFSL